MNINYNSKLISKKAIKVVIANYTKDKQKTNCKNPFNDWMICFIEDKLTVEIIIMAIIVE